MTWAPLLLADPSPCLRLLVLKDLFQLGDDDPEVIELHDVWATDPLVSELLLMQAEDGSWKSGDAPGLGSANKRYITSQVLARLGYLGFPPEHPAVRRGVAYLFSLQRDDGSWPLQGGYGEDEEGEGYEMIPLQTAIPLRGLAACGYGQDARAERAYDWLLEQQLPDGAWPTGVASGTYGYVGGYRRLAHSRWGCRTNTTAALVSLAYHPQRRKSPEAKQALDLLLGRETLERHTLGFEVARLIGAESVRGFLTFHAKFDLALILDLCWRVGATLEDDRVKRIVQFVQAQQGPYGLWEYAPRPQATRWVTFDLLRSLSRLDASGDWINLEPRTPFQAYPRRRKRY